MGVRPQFHILVGFVKANKKRNTDLSLDIDAEYRADDPPFAYFETPGHSDKHYHDIGVPGFGFTALREIIYNVEGDTADVVGLELLSRSGKYDDDALRFLAIADETYREDGYLVMTNNMGMSAWEREIREITAEDIACNRMVDGIFESSVRISRLEWARAVHYLSQAGWQVSQQELFYILVWDWR